jgi:hypothetical protein
VPEDSLTTEGFEDTSVPGVVIADLSESSIVAARSYASLLVMRERPDRLAV